MSQAVNVGADRQVIVHGRDGLFLFLFFHFLLLCLCFSFPPLFLFLFLVLVLIVRNCFWWRYLGLALVAVVGPNEIEIDLLLLG